MITPGVLLADNGGFNNHMGGWMWLWGVAMMVLFAVFVVWLVRTSVGTAGTVGPVHRDPTDRAREILAERYASGEISTDEYRERINELH